MVVFVDFLEKFVGFAASEAFQRCVMPPRLFPIPEGKVRLSHILMGFRLVLYIRIRDGRQFEFMVLSIGILVFCTRIFILN